MRRTILIIITIAIFMTVGCDNYNTIKPTTSTTASTVKHESAFVGSPYLTSGLCDGSTIILNDCPLSDCEGQIFSLTQPSGYYNVIIDDMGTPDIFNDDLIVQSWAYQSYALKRSLISYAIFIDIIRGEHYD